MDAFATADAQRPDAVLPAQMIVDDIRTEWHEARENWQAAGDEPRRLLAEKIMIVCESLQDLVNEQVLLSQGQRSIVTSMIISLADNNALPDLQDPGEGGLLLLPLATYINSCRV